MICKKDECCGCRACYDVCPKGCIEFKEESGCTYATVNEELCINCNLCKRVCPALNSETHPVLEAYAGVHCDKEVVRGSASGGAFAAISDIAIKRGYVVFGVLYDENLKVVHDFSRDIDGCKAFFKSKYVLSNTNGSYSKIKKMLDDGEKVLFSGTPCQVSALKNYVGPNDNLLCIDLVCHGAPEQWVFDEEIKYLEKKHNDKVVKFDFRNKNKVNGVYNSRTAKVCFANKKESCFLRFGNDPFLRGYYLRLFYRNSCKTCKYAMPNRCGDITLADAWGIEKLYPDMDPLKGVSLMLFNSDKGKAFLEPMKEYMNLIPVDKKWAFENNEQLRKPTDMHRNSDKFFDNPRGYDFEKLVFQLTKPGFLRKCKTFVRGYVVNHIINKNKQR